MASRTLYSQRDPALKKRDDFEDILEERRNSSDLKYALKCYMPVLYKGVTPCKPSMIKTMVLQSEQLRYVVTELSKETGEAPEVIQGEALAILEEMGHKLQLGTIRFFAYMLNKAFKVLYQRIRVNEDGIQRLQQAIQDHPLVLLPSHRSYMDFLIVSYLLYTYDLALPVIAAGMGTYSETAAVEILQYPLLTKKMWGLVDAGDEIITHFLGMKFVGEMLRMSGAFFIRRSFGGDRLYWAVFSEYVKTMLRNGYAPIEFFLEGTRSRTCKSLTPKLGLLSIAMEPFFKGEVFDVSMVPISISYGRVLEEALYARELLGVPKPKESTSGLLKARRILSEDYGSIHVYFGQPVSLRSLAQGRVNRSQYNLMPRHIPRRPGEDVQVFVNDVAYKMVRLQEENMVLRPWVLVATILLQNPHGVEAVWLTEQTAWLRGLAQAFGAFLDWPDHISASRAVASGLALHPNLVCAERGRVRLATEPKGTGAGAPEEDLFNHAVTVLSCASYRNQVLHVFLRPALLAMAMAVAPTSRKDDVYSCFGYLRDVFSNEFVLCPGAEVQDFDEACFLLTKCSAIQILKQDIVATERGRPTLSFLSAMFQPFLLGYQVVCRYLCEEVAESLPEKSYVSGVRSYAVKRILSGELACLEVLSSDLQKNVLAALLRMGALRKSKAGEQVTLRVNKSAINTIENTLGGQVSTQKPVLARL